MKKLIIAIAASAILSGCVMPVEHHRPHPQPRPEHPMPDAHHGQPGHQGQPGGEEPMEDFHME